MATSLTPTTTGFTATFNAPVNTERPQSLRHRARMGPADATLVGQTTGPVTGSLVVSPDGETITFIKTAGLLAPDTYTITLYSGANAFESTTGALLDGIGNGIPGDNLTYTFTVNPAGEQRGRGQHPELHPGLSASRSTCPPRAPPACRSRSAPARTSAAST